MSTRTTHQQGKSFPLGARLVPYSGSQPAGWWHPGDGATTAYLSAKRRGAAFGRVTQQL